MMLNNLAIDVYSLIILMVMGFCIKENNTTAAVTCLCFMLTLISMSIVLNKINEIATTTDKFLKELEKQNEPQDNINNKWGN